MRVTIESGPDRGTSADVATGVLTIGRHESCDLVLTDQQASSRHAAIEVAEDGSLSLRDLGSTNGTLVDGKPVEDTVALTGNERVEIGESVLQLSVEPDARTVVRRVITSDTVIRQAPGADQVTTIPPPPAGTPPPLVGAGAAPPPASPVAPPAPERGAPAVAASAPAGGGGRKPNPKILAGAGGLLLLAGVVVVMIVVLSGGSSKLTQEQLIARATPSVARIQGNQGAGSGIVIDVQRGLVLTNAHVVVGNSGLKAQIGNDAASTTPVRLVGASPCDDLAVVKLVNPVNNLKALPLGAASSVHAGDQVTVLGFPGSFQTTPGSQQTGNQQASTVVANTGTVSQVGVQGAPDPSLPTYQNLIVHQAPTNHGNSGGPLLNQNAQVIGINTLGNPDNQGQYYSISIDYAKRLLPDLEAGKSHGLIGWDLAPLSASDTNLLSELQRLYSQDPSFSGDASRLASDTASFLTASPPTSGMYDLRDQPGSAADKAGTAGFVIDKINGNPVTKLQDVCDIINSASSGQTLRIHNYNIDSGSDPTQLSAELNLARKNPAYTADLKVP